MIELPLLVELRVTLTEERFVNGTANEVSY